MNSISKKDSRNWKRMFVATLALWFCSTVALSFPLIRGVVAYPLYVSEPDAKGEVAYVMADGVAYWERLYAASDLYHMKRISRIVILEEAETSRFSFVRDRSETVTERAIEFLGSLGVPSDRVSTIRADPASFFGSWSEAQAFVEQESTVSELVVVTSAPHTRRSLLCFRRSLSPSVAISIYAPTGPSESWEVFDPIWKEYAKFAIYSVAVW